MRFEGFTLVRELGRGGTSSVHLAVEDASGRQVALKVLSTELTQDATALSRLYAEAEAAARLDHPSIVRVTGSGHSGEHHYIVTEYVEGATLAQVLAGECPDLLDRSEPRAVARFFAALAGALAHAHAAGVMHRDFKPSNILIDRGGHPRLADFGLARGLGGSDLTRTGSLVGTVWYMSPEQCRGDGVRLDARSDLFSFGAVFYEALTGRRPFDDDSPLAILRAITEQEPVSPRRLCPDLPAPLQTICAKCLEKDPRHRYASAAELERDLLAFAEGRPITARPPSWSRRCRSVMRRRRGALLAIAVPVVVALAAAGVGWVLRAEQATTVLLRSDPPGAEVHLRRLRPDDLRYDPPRRLGRTPLRVSLESGPARLIFVGPDGGVAEVFRCIPDHEDDAVAFEVNARPSARTAADRGMVRIEAGTFTAGFAPDPSSLFAERQAHVEAFEIDAEEVTVGEFRRFLEETGRPEPEVWAGRIDARHEDLPAAGVSWELALAYAEWAGKRLPTQLEFERAARGRDGRLRPWGMPAEPPESTRVWACVDRTEATEQVSAIQDVGRFLELVGPVGSHPRDRSAEGALDLLGSVSEWIETPWRTESADGTASFSPHTRMLVSSNWAMRDPLTHVGIVIPLDASSDHGLAGGFRCARSIDPLDPGSAAR